MSEGCCLWLTGLSGAGKSTLAAGTATELRGRGYRVEVLDGDEVRAELCGDLGFSHADRELNVRRLAYLAGLLSRNGVVVIVAAISPYRSGRAQARRQVGDCFAEVWVKASLDACEQRDVKGLYARARAGEIENFTGVSDPYEAPRRAELVIDTELHGADESVAELTALVERRLVGQDGFNPRQVPAGRTRL